MNDLTEQLVKKKKNAKYYINVFLIIFAAIAIVATLIIFAFITGPAYLVYLAMFAGMFSIYGVWYFITCLRVEYEYSFLPTTLRIDRIISKRKRKPMLKIDIKLFDDFFKYTDAEMSKRKFTKIYRAAASEFGEENYVACFHSEAKGKCALIFTPNDQLLDAMKPFFNNDLRKKMFLENRR